ncbi:TonB-linked SusC/RagA family outer membrane protein [Filimonas zeae]|uniref:SusC/RagA family TonB-linked outer membrane protein n=1 Tax=Filimonas zeae TaxID=1737353 RepID=A0A917INB6_9BACT|nr:TonB-dependent receptor [Filimonas zeae]MDR6337415.1 TonB-linked SusC/RagA family outer membrane protein [Filimonas zeae]GGH58504.1 SusC/RagA family TonB-linked outer membrane protein [Filimonas zeae]
MYNTRIQVGVNCNTTYARIPGWAMILFCILVAGSVEAAVGQKLHFAEKKMTIGGVFKEIRKQTGYTTLWKSDMLNEGSQVTFQQTDVELTKALETCLSDKGLTYQIEDKTIAIVKKEEKERTTQYNHSYTPVADTPVVSGMVTDSLGKPVAGANIEVVSKKLTAQTDANGRFTIVGALPKDYLAVSLADYQTKMVQVPATGGNAMEIVLLVNKALDEVVVVGFGKQKKISLTGAIATVGTKELRQSPVANLTNALAGRLPGLITLQNSGEPGYDGAQLWIRGMATFTGNQAPLIMVDGVERAFSGIDANEVESISILKDASSTAVYGVRGANGVILVTTRRGKEGKSQINFTAQTGLQAPTRLPEYLDSYDALSLYRVGLINDGQNYAMYTDEYLNKFRDRSHPAYQYLYPNVNWLKELLEPNALMYQGNLNVSGGNKSVKYFTSISYLRQNGLYKYADLSDYNIQAVNNKYNFRSNVDVTITKDLTMELNLGEIVYDNNYPNVSASAIFSDMQGIPPYLYPMSNPDGSVAYLPAKPYNPYGRLTQGGYQRNFSNTLQATAGFNLNMPFITEGLSTRVRLSFDSYSYRNVTRGKSYFTYQYSLANDQETDLTKGTYTKVTDGTNNLGYDVAANSNRRTQVEAYINYNRTFAAKHAVSGMLLYQQQSFFEAVGTGQAILGLPYKYNGFIGRATYAFNSKLFSEFNFGYNGSENFPAGKRYDFFPSVSLGYVLSEEEFFQKAVPVINFFKIRSSAGTVGNDKIGGERFLYQSTWALGAAGYQFGLNRDGLWYNGSVEDRTGNPDVTWEKARKYNIGLDIEMFRGALTFTGDVFYEKRNDILARPGTIPSSIGIVNLPYVNLGSVSNKGFEFSVEYRRQMRSYGYFVKGNYSFARNKILEMDEPQYVGREYQRRTGRRVNEQYGLTALGLFQSQDDINKAPSQTAYGTVQPGDIMYKDINGDGVVNSMDESYLGKSSTPEQIMGFALGFNAKGFDVSALFQGAFGGNVWLTGPRVWPFSGDAGVLADVKDNYWTKDRPNAAYPRISYAANANNDQNSTFWLRSTDYVRLKNVEVGYTVSPKLTQRIGIRNARVFVNGINLITWNSIKIFDPEIPNSSGNYPQQRVFNTGVTIGL